ncbi:MAG: SRPBCC family protein [Planctomycetota bacterium]|jgi:hypothetical protein
MAIFEATVEIRACPGAIFQLTHDYSRRLEWDTLLKEARLLDGAQAAGPGVKSVCVGRSALLGLSVETVYITFDPPWLAAIEMTRGPALFGNFAASIRHEVIRPGVTRVIYRGHVETRPRWLRWLLEPLVNHGFSRETKRRLNSLKRTLET